MRRAKATFLAAAIGVFLALGAAPASAALSHTFSGSFGSAATTPANPYPLSAPTDVAVDSTSHAVYVTDPANHRVEKFDSDGNLILMFGDGVNATTGGDICTVASGDTCQAGTSGAAPGQLATPTYLAVDNSSGPSAGDVYVGDAAGIVTKFDSNGALITSWGVQGQKDGTDASDLAVFGPLFGLDVNNANGDLYVGGKNYGANEWQYKQDGTYVKWYVSTSASGFAAPTWLKVDPAGSLYSASTPFGTFGTKAEVWKNVPVAVTSNELTRYEFATDWSTTGFGFDPVSHDLYQGVDVRNEGASTDHPAQIDHYSVDCNPPATNPCDPIDTFGSGHLSGAMGIAVDGSSHTVYVANSATGSVAAFGDARPIVTTGAATDVTESSVTLTAHIDPAGRGDVTECYFEYGFDTSYGKKIPCAPDPASGNFTGPTDVTATISGLSPGTRDHYRVVATNSAGATANGLDRTFITTAPPAINGLASANLTATTADLNGQINPNGLETTYRFEYGPTPSYGQVAPIPDGTLSASNSDQPVGVHLSDLQPHVVYHYRLVATNDDGTTATPDHTFNFYPPDCPNENVRQQVQANYLPDCRAYELVSPGDAGGTQLYPGGPNTGRATRPSRFSFTGLWATIPGSGGKPINSQGDLYVATRTPNGWVTRYVGLPADEAALDGGPPMGLPAQGGAGFEGNNSSMANGGTPTDKIQSNVLTDPGMSRFLDWNDGNQSVGSSSSGDISNLTPIASNAPYMWAADGSFLGRLPSNLGAVPPGKYPESPLYYSHAGSVGPSDQPLTVAPGGPKALDCPGVISDAASSGRLFGNACPGDVNASADLSHFAFATEWNVFAPGGQLTPPGSVYDNDVDNETVTVASKTPAGDDIPSEPTNTTGSPLRIPGLSGDGSHILIGAEATGGCGVANCPVPPCGGSFGATIPCPMQASHLYMRVNDAVTYDVSRGHAVDYVGMTDDGGKVYFTTADRLTADDQDTSTDLYLWSEATDSLTLASKSSAAGGGGDSCNSDFIAKCGVVTYSNLSYCQLGSGIGGNCHSDNSIAAKNGDIYFLSPELLDGSRGIPNQGNLYVYRNGAPQYVTTFTTGPFCYTSPISGTTNNACSDTPIVRLQVSPDDSHMALVTASPLTQYDNAGHLEMYTYDPASRQLICVSCIPSGDPPSSDVTASQNGLFMTDDGRAFFATDDALVHGDTNQAIDVYEYADGRPQLITPGTGETSTNSSLLGSIQSTPGLVGVSADGTDVYFSTYDTLVPSDHNGLFLKFYDARSAGGFSAPAPPLPCNAADECHGPGSEAPAPIANGTGASGQPGGNVVTRRKRHGAKHKRRKRHRHHKRHGRRGKSRHRGHGRGRAAHRKTGHGQRGGNR